MPRPLILLAASGLAREVAEVARATGQFELLGYLDDDAALKGTTIAGLEVLGGLDTIAEHPTAEFVVCAGSGIARQRMVERLAVAGVTGARFATVIHPTASVAASCTVATGTVVLAGCVLTADVTLGAHVVLMPQVTLTHDDVIADFATLCAGVTLGGDVRVGRAAYLGMNSAVRERTTIGEEAIVGMGSAVLRDIPGSEVWAGMPARRLAK